MSQMAVCALNVMVCLPNVALQNPVRVHMRLHTMGARRLRGNGRVFLPLRVGVLLIDSMLARRESTHASVLSCVICSHAALVRDEITAPPLRRAGPPLGSVVRGDMATKEPRSVLREASHQIIAGGSAGLVEICLMHPLDVVKTRFQIQRGTSDPNSYKSLGDCFRTVIRNEGISGFYKGILPPIVAETPKRAVKFFTFEQYKKLLNLSPLSPGLALSVAGLGAGLTEAVVVNPFEVVKVSLQANRDSFAEQPSSFAQARRIINSEGFGLRGLNKGLTSTLGRHGVFNMIYFGFYFNVKDAIPSSPDPTLEFMRKFAIGLVSGTISSCVNIPFDVAKSRIQGPQPVPGEIKYRTCFQSMALVYREEGYMALYKGLVPKIMRLGPGGAVMLLVYEYVSGWLQRNW
ncbi:mitochondrial 2-oxodicarboxylate carrier [Spinachia spinachia]